MRFELLYWKFWFEHFPHTLQALVKSPCSQNLQTFLLLHVLVYFSSILVTMFFLVRRYRRQCGSVEFAGAFHGERVVKWNHTNRNHKSKSHNPIWPPWSSLSMVFSIFQCFLRCSKRYSWRCLLSTLYKIESIFYDLKSTQDISLRHVLSFTCYDIYSSRDTKCCRQISWNQFKVSNLRTL